MMKKTILAVMLSTLALTACNDDDDDHHSPGNGGNPPGTQQGILTDGPIENVRYETSSGVKGSTNAEGKFNYNTGDTIRFFIGNLQLGEQDGVPAQARITPTDLYENDPDIPGNEDEELEEALTIFLQSIDADYITPPTGAPADYNAHDNGIQITQDVINRINTAFTSATTFETALEGSDNSITTLIQDQLQLSDVTPVTPDEAAANIQEAFYKDIAGTWQLGSADKSDKVILVVYTDGSYKLGEADNADDDGEPGYELGNLQWNWKGGVITPVIDENGDTNGSWGLSDSEGDEGYTLTFDGTNLVLTETGLDEDDTSTLTRVENSTNGLVGTWELDDTHVLVFLNDGYYFLIDTTGGEDCGPEGIEYGQYTTSNNTLTVTDNLFDTNESCGLYDGQTSPFVLGAYTVNATTMTLTPTGEPAVTFTRADFQRDPEPAPGPQPQPQPQPQPTT